VENFLKNTVGAKEDPLTQFGFYSNEEEGDKVS
jgi:hypothetical protein